MARTIYQFAGVELDCALREIRAGELREEISPRVFELLELLLRHHDRVVSKEELAAALWPDRVVTDASISQAVRKARASLEKFGVDPSIIRNRHGLGYRLEADVVVIPGPADAGEWKKHPFRIGAVVAVLGGILVTAANISDVLSWFLPDDSVQLLEETKSTVRSTDAKVEELVELMRDQAARSGTGLDPQAENTIRNALKALAQSVDARKSKALDLLAMGNVAEAAESIESVAQELDMASDQSIDAAAASWREAGVIYYTSDIDKAVSSLESAYRLRPDDDNSLHLAYAYMRASRPNDAVLLFEEVAQTATSSDARSSALRGLGIAYKQKAEYATARTYLEQALAELAGTDNLRQRGLVLLQVGSIDRAQGKNDVARKHFETAASYAKSIDDSHLLAEALNNLGIILAVTGQFDDATDALSQSHEIHVARHDLAGQANALGNLGATALTEGDESRAETYLLQSVEIGERLGWQRSIVLDLINLGGIAGRRQQYDVADEQLNRALDIAVSAQLDEITPIILANLGENAGFQGDFDEACRFWREALPPLEKAEHAAADIVSGWIDEQRCD